MTATNPLRLLATVREQTRRRSPARSARGILCVLVLCALGQFNRATAAEDVPTWMKPLAWANPASSNRQTAAPPLPHPSEMTVFEPLRFRADRRVPPRQDEYTANEPHDFETVSQPFRWENPQGRVEDPLPTTDAERIAYEKKHFAWIRPFYWNDREEVRTWPLRQEYVGTPAQQLPTSTWAAPFMWSNAAPSYRWSRSAVVPKDPAWIAESARGLYRLPPIDPWDAQLAAFIYHQDTLPPPPEEAKSAQPDLGITDEEVPSATAETSTAERPTGDNVAETLENLPFQDVDQNGELDTDLDAESVTAGKGIIAEADTLGEEPDTRNSLQFLRADTVLLDPGDMQFDYGFSYTLFDTQLPAINSSLELENARIRQRELLVPLEIRYGLTRRLQLFANMPFGWSNIEVSLSDFERFENDGGQGDLIFGGTFLLREANECQSDLVWTLAASAPTGVGEVLVPVITPLTPQLGTGTWAIASNLLWIRNYDPVVLFYGFGTRQNFTTEINGQSFRPGQEYNYQMGVGFAVNSKVTFSTRFNGAYVTEPRLDGTRFLGTIQEPMSISLATTVAQCNGLIEPFVDFGLTPESIETRFGITWTRY